MSDHAKAIEQIRRVEPTTVREGDLAAQHKLFDRFHEAHPFKTGHSLGVYSVMEARFMGSIHDDEIRVALESAGGNRTFSPTVNNWTRVDLDLRAKEAKGQRGSKSRDEIMQERDFEKRLKLGRTVLNELKE